MDQQMVPLPSENGNRGAEPTLSTQNHVAVTVGDHPNDSEGFAELEIRSLMWMEQMGNEVYAKAFRRWTEQDSLCANRIDVMRNHSSSRRNEIYQSFGYYSVFQGVLLTAVAQANVLLCPNLWTMYCLSALVTLVTLGGVWQKFKAILALENTIHNVTFSRLQYIRQATRLLQRRGSFDFNEHARDGNVRDFSQWKLQLQIALVVLFLVVFLGLIIISLNRIACHSYAPAPAATAA